MAFSYTNFVWKNQLDIRLESVYEYDDQYHHFVLAPSENLYHIYVIELHVLRSYEIFSITLSRNHLLTWQIK